MERLEQAERDRDAVLEHHARVVPRSLDALSPEERHALYKLLRLEVLAYPDKSLEVSGAILVGSGPHRAGEGDTEPDGGGPEGPITGIGLGASNLTRTRGSQNTQPVGLRFRAVLGPEPRVELTLA